MHVIVMVPIQMEIKGIDKVEEVRYVLDVMEQIIGQSCLEADPCIETHIDESQIKIENL